MSLCFFQPAGRLDAVSNSEFVAGLRLSDSAGDRLRDAARRADAASFFADAQKSLSAASRRFRRYRADAGGSPALWSTAFFDRNERSIVLAEVLAADAMARGSGGRPPGNGRARKGGQPVIHAPLANWTCMAVSGDVLSLFELLMLLEILLAAGPTLPPDLFTQVWRLAFERSVDFSVGMATLKRQSEAPDCKPFTAGELPLLVGLLFDDIVHSARLVRSGTSALKHEIRKRTDTDGVPHAELLPRFPFWLASFVRSTLVAEAFGVSVWDKTSQERLYELTGCAAALCTGDGRAALCEFPGFDMTTLLRLAARLSGWKKKSSVYGYALALDRNDSSGSGARLRGVTKQKAKPLKRRPAIQSDWAALACLRNRLSVDADALVVSHAGATPQIHLSATGADLIRGPWTVEVDVKSAPVELDGWSCVCWHSDKDADYMELQCDCDGVLRVERQLLLSRREHFAILADCVWAAGSNEIRYRSRLPMPDVDEAGTDRVTRELTLANERLCARIFPIFLEQDRVISAPGGCTFDDGGVLLELSATGGAYAPVVIDWHPDRTMEPVDWQRLTVTELRRTLPSDHAAASRVRFGTQQLLVYRSLKNTSELRAVLGHHTGNETVIAGITHKGNVDPIVLVEA